MRLCDTKVTRAGGSEVAGASKGQACKTSGVGKARVVGSWDERVTLDLPLSTDTTTSTTLAV